MARYHRRDFLRLTSTAAATGLLAAACSGDLGEDDNSAGDPVKIGLILPEDGVYKSLGDDLRRGWDLYLKLHDNKLGGREVRVITANEGEKPDVAVKAAEHVLGEKVHVATGIVSSASLVEIQPMFTEAKVPLISMNASPAPVQGKEYGWRTSYVNDHPSLAFGEYLARVLDGGSMAVITPDYAAGTDHVNAINRRFLAAGGRLSGDPIRTPFPMGDQSFEPYLQQIEYQGPDAVYCFFAGAEAVRFVKEYRAFGLADKYPLYAPGWLTEGDVLVAQGEDALGILTSNNYAHDLDNAANRTFVAEYQKAYNLSPSSYALAAYDAGWVLDRAIRAVGNDLTSERIENEIGKVGKVDSPRGPWEFGKNRSPVQKWYLREVRKDGEVLGNVVIDELATLGDEA